MTDQQSKVSHLLDEFSADEAGKKILDELQEDVNLQYRLRRYQLIGQAMRRELPQQIDTEFSSNVMAEIDLLDKEIDSSKSRSFNSEGSGRDSATPGWAWSLLKPYAGMTVAASVALVSVSLWYSTNPHSETGAISEQLVTIEQQKIERLASQPIQTGTQSVSSTLDNGMRWKINNHAPALQQKLNAYLVNHTEYSNSMQGLIPQARVAGFDAE